MPLSINGRVSYGVAVAEPSISYRIKAKFARRSEVIKLTSCHREIVSFDKSSKLDYTYNPVRGVEDVGFCPIEISALDEGGEHTWAFIDFATFEDLPAQTVCNGQESEWNGVSICQTRTSLEQLIEFREQVEVMSLQDCPLPTSEDQKVFHYQMPAGICVYVFQSKGKNIHRHTVLGYEKVLRR